MEAAKGKEGGKGLPTLDEQMAQLTQAAKFLTPIDPVKKIDIPAKSGIKNAKRVKLYYGPIEIKGANVRRHAS